MFSDELTFKEIRHSTELTIARKKVFSGELTITEARNITESTITEETLVTSRLLQN